MKEKRPKPIGIGRYRLEVVRPASSGVAGEWYWRAVRYVDGRSVTHWTGSGTADQAQRAVAELIAAGDDRPARERRGEVVYTVRDVLELHAGYRAERGEARTLADGTVSSRKTAARHLVEFLGDVAAAELGQLHVDDYVRRRLAQGRAPASVHLHLRELRQALRWGARRGLCPHLDLEVPKTLNLREQRRNRYTPSEGEIARVLAELPRGHWSRIVVAVLVGTGARIGEVAQLRIGDVGLHQDGERWTGGSLRLTGAGKIGKVRRTGKTGPRLVPIAAELAAELAAWMTRPGVQASAQAPLWGVTPATVTGRLQERVNLACERAGLPRWSPQATRRRASGALLGRHDVNLRDYKHLMGHSPSTALRTYVQPDQAGMATLAEALPVAPDASGPHTSTRTGEAASTKKARRDKVPDGP